MTHFEETIDHIRAGGPPVWLRAGLTIIMWGAIGAFALSVFVGQSTLATIAGAVIGAVTPVILKSLPI